MHARARLARRTDDCSEHLYLSSSGAARAALLAMHEHPIANSLHRQHLECERLFDELLARVEAGDYGSCDAIWDRVAEALEAHMRFEEERILPLLEATPEGKKTGVRIRSEHAGFRGELSTFGVAVELHTLRLRSARELIARLRAHAAFENEALYPWADLDGPIPGDVSSLVSTDALEPRAMASTSGTSIIRHARIVLAAIDDSHSAAVVVQQASEIASGLHASLHIVHVVDSFGLPALAIGGSPVNLPSAKELMRSAGVDLLKQAHDGEAQIHGEVIVHLRAGTPWREIVKLATDLQADLLVIGGHDGKGMARLLASSHAESIVQASPCAVLIARPKLLPAVVGSDVIVPEAAMVRERQVGRGLLPFKAG